MAANDQPDVTIFYIRQGFQLPPMKEVEEIFRRDWAKDYGLHNHNWSPSVKFSASRHRDYTEAKSMLLVEANTTIPVPKVYAVCARPLTPLYFGKPNESDGWEITYTFWEVMPGLPIANALHTPQWNAAAQANVQNELKDYVRQLRAIPGGDYVGRTDRAPITNSILSDHTDDTGILIP